MNRMASNALIAGVCCIAAFASLIFGDPARAADVTPTDPEKIAQYGIAAFKKGDYVVATRYLSARVKMKPEDANVYYYLGNCFLKNGQNEAAAHMFSTCVRLAPSTQAGKYALSALETLSTLPKTPDPPAPVVDLGPDAAQSAATKDALMSEKPVDQAFNDAITNIKSHRQTLKTRVDRLYTQMQDEMQSLSQKGNPTYAADLEKLQRQAENKVQDLQTKELRLESRLMAPNKIDMRAIPLLPVEKIDDTKTALGSLLDYFKADKPFDPFGTDITPELTSKFMTIKDLFGELATYMPSSRRAAKQVFAQLKNSVEIKQDSLDQQLYQLKENLIHDVVTIKINYGNVASQRMNQVTAASFITGAKLPRNDQEQLTPQEMEIKQAVERSKKRIQELAETYYRDMDGIVAGAKERLGGMVAQTGQMNSQMKKPSGNIQLVPLGTDTYTRNYINFGDRPVSTQSVTGTRIPAVQPVPLHAVAKKLSSKGAKKGVATDAGSSSPSSSSTTGPSGSTATPQSNSGGGGSSGNGTITPPSSKGASAASAQPGSGNGVTPSAANDQNPSKGAAQ